METQEARANKKAQVCECADFGCPMHKGRSHCTRPGETILFRSDMQDATGTYFCAECAADAFNSGLFDGDPDRGEG